MTPERIRTLDSAIIQRKCGGNYANKTISEIYFNCEENKHNIDR